MRPPLNDPTVRRIALVRLRVGLGDLLCTMPALRHLRAVRPDLRVTLVTWPQTAAVVERMRDLVDDLLPFPGADGIPDGPVDAASWDRFTAAAAARRLDLAVQAYGDRPAANHVTAALGARLVGGFAATGWRPPAVNAPLYLPYPAGLHETDRQLRLLEHLGLPPGAPNRLFFPIRDDDEREQRDILARTGLRRRGYVVVHPGASCATRRWLPDRFAAVADALAADGLTVVLTGVPGEAAVTAAVARRMSHPCVDLTGRTSLGGFAALLRDSAVVISNDTGTAHLAAAVGARTVTIFLSGDPRRWAHRGPRHHAVAPSVQCAPCPHLECPIDFRCARSIAAAQIVAAGRRVAACG